MKSLLMLCQLRTARLPRRIFAAIQLCAPSAAAGKQAFQHTVFCCAKRMAASRASSLLRSCAGETAGTNQHAWQWTNHHGSN
eukprot:1158604-Pelagomonas_calceolata.AAC.10